MVRYTANGCPSEDDEEHVLSEYCDLRGWKHTHFSNETYTTSWNQKRKMKYLGVHSGIPDHFILIPVKGQLVPVFIEMKRQKGGTISDDQFLWVKRLRMAGMYATVCEGGQKAIVYASAVADGDQQIIDFYHKNFDEKFEKWLKKPKKTKKSVEF